MWTGGGSFPRSDGLPQHDVFAHSVVSFSGSAPPYLQQVFPSEEDDLKDHGSMSQSNEDFPHLDESIQRRLAEGIPMNHSQSLRALDSRDHDSYLSSSFRSALASPTGLILEDEHDYFGSRSYPASPRGSQSVSSFNSNPNRARDMAEMSQSTSSSSVHSGHPLFPSSVGAGFGTLSSSETPSSHPSVPPLLPGNLVNDSLGRVDSGKVALSQSSEGWFFEHSNSGNKHVPPYPTHFSGSQTGHPRVAEDDLFLNPVSARSAGSVRSSHSLQSDMTGEGDARLSTSYSGCSGFPVYDPSRQQPDSISSDLDRRGSNGQYLVDVVYHGDPTLVMSSSSRSATSTQPRSEHISFDLSNSFARLSTSQNPGDSGYDLVSASVGHSPRNLHLNPETYSRESGMRSSIHGYGFESDISSKPDSERYSGGDSRKEGFENPSLEWRWNGKQVVSAPYSSDPRAFTAPPTPALSIGRDDRDDNWSVGPGTITAFSLPASRFPSAPPSPRYRTEISTGSKQDFSNLIPADEYRRYSQSGFSGDPSRSEPFLYNSRHNEYPISGTQDPFAGNAQMRTSNQHAPRTPSSDYPYASSRPHLQDPSGNIGYSVPTVSHGHILPTSDGSGYPYSSSMAYHLDPRMPPPQPLNPAPFVGDIRRVPYPPSDSAFQTVQHMQNMIPRGGGPLQQNLDMGYAGYPNPRTDGYVRTEEHDFYRSADGGIREHMQREPLHAMHPSVPSDGMPRLHPGFPATMPPGPNTLLPQQPLGPLHRRPLPASQSLYPAIQTVASGQTNSYHGPDVQGMSYWSEFARFDDQHRSVPMSVPGSIVHPSFSYMHQNMPSTAYGDSMGPDMYSSAGGNANAKHKIGTRPRHHYGGVFASERPGEVRNRVPVRTNPSSRMDESTQNRISVQRIRCGMDERTTVMVRNIPNKYTQVMLLDEIDEFFQGTYDFFYLPIDFKNNANVGYAFINFRDPLAIVEFAEMFSGRKWRRFNSEKICEVTYARIQGKDAMIQNFQRSRLLEEDESVQPLLFDEDGQREPFIRKLRKKTSPEDSPSTEGEILTLHDVQSHQDSSRNLFPFDSSSRVSPTQLSQAGVTNANGGFHRLHTAPDSHPISYAMPLQSFSSGRDEDPIMVSAPPSGPYFASSTPVNHGGVGVPFPPNSSDSLIVSGANLTRPPFEFSLSSLSDPNIKQF